MCRARLRSCGSLAVSQPKSLYNYNVTLYAMHNTSQNISVIHTSLLDIMILWPSCHHENIHPSLPVTIHTKHIIYTSVLILLVLLITKWFCKVIQLKQIIEQFSFLNRVIWECLGLKLFRRPFGASQALGTMPTVPNW